MGQTASIAAKVSWPQLIIPLLGATVARFTVPKSKNIMLWGAGVAFVLSFFTGVGANAVAQNTTCQKRTYRHAIPAALAPALMSAATFVTMHFLLARVFKAPAKEGETALKVMRHPNAIFAVGAAAGVMGFVGSMMGASIATKQACA